MYAEYKYMLSNAGSWYVKRFINISTKMEWMSDKSAENK